MRLNEDVGLFFVVFLQVHFQNHTKTLNVKNDKMVFFIELFPELKKLKLLCLKFANSQFLFTFTKQRKTLNVNFLITYANIPEYKKCNALHENNLPRKLKIVHHVPRRVWVPGLSRTNLQRNVEPIL